VIEAVPIWALLPLYAIVEMVWLPSATLVESQLKVYGGDDAR
jgi:hypothetical protein